MSESIERYVSWLIIRGPSKTRLFSAIFNEYPWNILEESAPTSNLTYSPETTDSELSRIVVLVSIFDVGAV